MPGDSVVIWRSGPSAGIVGVARVAESPRESTSSPSEQQFATSEESDATTRVKLRVRPVPFVSKDTLASHAEFSTHQIIKAPMGTVFPLEELEWLALQQLVPAVPADAPEPDGWPTRFSWEQRTKSMTPMPGGVEHYFATIEAILRCIVDERLGREKLDAWVQQRFDVSKQRSAIVVRYLARAGLLSLSTSSSQLTPAGERWLQQRDDEFLFALVHGRIRFVGEFLAFLDAPKTTEEVLQYANQHYGMNWTTSAQITRRRQFLASLRYLEADDSGGMRRTDAGTAALSGVQVAPQLDLPIGGPDSTTEPKPIGLPVPALRTEPRENGTAEVLIARLKETAHASNDPTAFEEAVRDAFGFLGFEALRLGGSGQTDVLITAHLGDDAYRVVIDAKTTAKEAVGDGQIDWTTIDEHRVKHHADHASIVGPAFRQGRVTERATDGRSVALIDVGRLSDVVRQHAAAPLDLAAYRNLFRTDADADDVVEIGESLRRQFILAAEILRITDDIQRNQGGIEISDYFWNLDAFAEQFDGERASREEIAAVCEMLSHAPLSLLRTDGHRYRSLGSRDTQTSRLRLLADLLEAGAPEFRAD